MSIEEKIKAIVEVACTQRSGDAALKSSQDFVKQKQAEGVIQRQRYSLPPVDTIGERRHRMMAHQNR